MKRKKKFIHEMCLWYRSDYNIRKKDTDPSWVLGMTKYEADMLYITMEKIYYEHLKPLKDSGLYNNIDK